MRSAVSHINGLEQLHIISPDFDAPAPSDAPAANANVHAHTLALSPRASPLPPEPTGPTGPVDEVIRLPSERSEGQATDSYVAEMGRGRMGQIPTWLDPDLGPDMVAVGEDARRETGNSPKLRVHHGECSLLVPLISLSRSERATCPNAPRPPFRLERLPSKLASRASRPHQRFRAANLET